MVSVRLNGVSKEYGQTTALENISFDAREGEFFTLVGPSGCGKTTTLRLIAGFESPSSGSIYFGNSAMEGIPPEERDIGIVFQNYALFPHMSVKENIAYGLRFRDPPGDTSTDERVAELLSMIGLEGMEDRSPDELSGGQRQRVALARAIAPSPQVLLLDEPMSALDARLREQLRIQVKELQSELDITTIYVTHDQAEALAISDRVAVLNNGSIEQIDKPEGIYRRPSTRFVAEFVGENNLFNGSVTEIDEHTITISVGSTSFTIDNDDTPQLTQNDTIVFSVRPEDITKEHPSNTFQATINNIEFLGEAYRIHAEWNDYSLTIRMKESPSSPVTVGFDPADAHIIGH